DGRQPFIKYDAPVTITSVDPDNRASFSELSISGGSNITFDGLIFDYEFNLGDPSWYRPFQIKGSEGITIKNSSFLGDVASGISEEQDGFGYAYGLSVLNSENIAIEGNEFETWSRGAVFDNVDDLIVSDNNIYGIKSDGLNFASVRSVLIENNYLHDFRDHEDSTAHRDFIQIWTTGTDTPSTDIVIRGNVFDIGTGSWTQSIFMRNGVVDTGSAGEEMFYRNILIEDNVIYNGHLHGITVGETDGLTIRNNSVLYAEGEMHGLEGTVTVPRINVKPESTSVIIEGNITSAISGYEGQVSWIVDGNALIQPSDYLETFITSSLDAGTGIHSFIALPGGLIEAIQAGAARSQFDVAPDTLTPQFLVHSDSSSSQSLVFDASLTVGSLGLILDSDAEFQWSFGDGGTATGRIVKHEFASPGHHDVTLTVITKDGTAAQAQYTAGLAGNDIVGFDARSGVFEALAYGEEAALDLGALPVIKTAEGHVLKLGGEGTQATIKASEISRFFGTEVFDLSMSLKADSSASWGEIARIHTSFTAHVDKNGNLVLTLFLEDGTRVSMTSNGIALNDGTSHDILIHFDGKVGFAEIQIDGLVVATTDVSGALGGGARSLDFGNPWGGQNFSGELSAFSLRAGSLDFPAYDGPVEWLESAVPVEEDTSPLVPTTPVDELGSDKTIEPQPDGTSQESEPEEPVAPSKPQPLDPTEPPTDEQAPSEEDSGSLEPILLKGGFKLDFTNIQNTNAITFHDNAHVVTTPIGTAITFDGKKDYVSLGRLTDFEDSQKIAFSVDFMSDSIKGGAERLVWNHVKVGLTLESDGIRVHAANEDDRNFSSGFKISGLDLHDGNRHNVTVMVDAETDRLQVVVDDILVLDEQGTDFNFVGAGGHEWGWSLGTAWNRWFDGEVYDFQVSSEFEFMDATVEDGTILA
ncbi:MAG: PKD domain-containing protein, partial [Anaerolineales bacterium]